MSFPSREERTACWAARDRYWECLDENKIPIEQSKGSPCEQFRKLYETGCPNTWVKHFDRRYNYLKFKNKIEKEGIPLPTTTSNRKHRVYREIV